MPIPTSVHDLVDRFQRNRDAYHAGQYNETQLRREFLDPFFETLGWDVNNHQGYAEPYKDVIHEDAIKVGGATKAPNYCFRIGGTRKFFLEAKKPSVNVRDDISAAFQLRRYAWSAKLPLSILSDFEEFAVYDCRVRPDKADKPATARILYLGYADYAARWDEIAGIFGRDAILRGSFDKYAESAAGKHGTAEVDDAFLAEIEGWRDALARNLALRNPDLAGRDLNHAVQATIDRLIFLRIAEDRGIEAYGRLLALTNAGQIYERLGDLFRQADGRYNSGLFHFEPEAGRPESPDRFTLGLALDDKPLKEILRSLYYPDSPYEFSVLPADILGQVYEQFLGKVIRLTPGHQAKVEDKPEVKKAGGVFYTPTYIVDTIVKQTVGPLLEGKTVEEVGQRMTADKRMKARGGKASKVSEDFGSVAPLRIADIACGSGSFLLGAYQYLLDWYRDRYLERLVRSDVSNLQSPTSNLPIYQSAGGEWRLTTAERKRILTTHLYGVDIDPQAVEVTKLSLLLKVLEGESAETLGVQLRLFQERALPDLAQNIKCGNSLIGPEFYDGQQLGLLDDEERYRINAFDWRAEFPGVFGPNPPAPFPHREGGVGSPLLPGEGAGVRSSGFDAIIGNPPYIRIQTLKEWAPLEVEHYKRAYASAGKGNYDIYVTFVERGLSLLGDRGRLGFILPHKFFNAQYGEPLRRHLAESRCLAEIVHFGDQQVFHGATTYTCLLFLDKAGRDEFRFEKVTDLDAWRGKQEAADHVPGTSQVPGTFAVFPTATLTAAEWNFSVGAGAGLFEKLRAMPVKLGDVAQRMYQGPITSADTVYLFKEFRTGEQPDITQVFSEALDEWMPIETSILKRVVRSGSIRRYRAEPTAIVLFPYEVKDGSARLFTADEMQRRHPLTWSYLARNKKLLEAREKGKFKDAQWYRFGRTQNLGLWEQTKLMVPYMVTDLAAYLDRSDNYYFINVTTGGYGIVSDGATGSLTYLCGLLNSRLLDFHFKRVSTTFHGGYFAANKQYIAQLPIRPITFTDPADRVRHDRMVALVESMLALHRQLAAAKTSHEQTALQRQIDATDRQIDRLVYELYDLTEEEARIVEESR
ncbi:MAG: Eco57I restriction-modification methylase domain-containing protein [Chloroflexi bacterium]|nr:Eco57I restriction-modification methylase domain-containing protein [Chloroflexota bacterium]